MSIFYTIDALFPTLTSSIASQNTVVALCTRARRRLSHSGLGWEWITRILGTLSIHVSAVSSCRYQSLSRDCSLTSRDFSLFQCPVGVKKSEVDDQ